MKQSFFQKRSVVAAFGIIALIAGSIFVQTSKPGGVTGNIILSDVYAFNLISLVGLLLIICSAVLIVYAVVKRS